jgi:hypothetical protein
VFFDANSGPARGILVTTVYTGDAPDIGFSAPYCGSLNTAGSNMMDYYEYCIDLSNEPGHAPEQFIVYGAVFNLSRANTFNSSVRFAPPPGGCVLTPPPVASLKRVDLEAGNVTYTLSLAGNLSVSEDIVISNGKFSSGAFNVTCRSFCTGSTAAAAIDFGSGTYFITGVDIFTRAFYVNSSINPVNIIAGTATLKFLNSSGVDNATIQASGAGKTLPKIWLAANPGSGSFYFYTPGTYASLRLNSGNAAKFETPQLFSFGDITTDTGGIPSSIRSASNGVNFQLAKTGGGAVYVDNCQIKDSQALVANTFYARNSLNQGNNANWTFLPNKPHFFNFF